MRSDSNQNTAIPATSKAELTASRSDFKVASVLLLVAAALLFYTFSFPMSGSYAGVENQWYVSPALFPLIICSLLMLCSAILLIKACLNGGASGLLLVKGWVGDWQEQRIRDRWYVIYILLFYVFAFIPSIDFYLASVIFLLSLCSRFYHESKQCLTRVPVIYLVLAIALIAIKQNVNVIEGNTWLSVNQDETVILYSDIAALLCIMSLLALNWFQAVSSDFKAALIQSLVVLLVPLFLVIIFTFVLYVPNPVEYGTVSNFLSYIVYDVLAVQ